MINRTKNWTVALLVSLIISIGFIYAARGLTEIYPKDTSILIILADGGLATLVSFLIVVLLSELAIVNTLVHPEIIEAKEAKGVILSKVSPYLGKGHKFCEVRNDANREVRQKGVIRKYYLTLEEYYNLDRIHLNFWGKLKLWRINRKIKKAGFDEYNFIEITNGITIPVFKKRKRFSLKRLRGQKYSKKVIFSIFSGLLFGYFGLMLAKDTNWGMVIYLTIQFLVFVANGLIQYFITRTELLIDYKDQIKEDTNFLYEFESSLIQHPELYIEKKVVESIEKVVEKPPPKEEVGGIKIEKAPAMAKDTLRLQLLARENRTEMVEQKLKRLDKLSRVAQ